MDRTSRIGTLNILEVGLEIREDVFSFFFYYFFYPFYIFLLYIFYYFAIGENYHMLASLVVLDCFYFCLSFLIVSLFFIVITEFNSCIMCPNPVWIFWLSFLNLFYLYSSSSFYRSLVCLLLICRYGRSYSVSNYENFYTDSLLRCNNLFYFLILFFLTFGIFGGLRFVFSLTKFFFDFLVWTKKDISEYGLQ